MNRIAKIRVLIVDDSASVRQTLSDMLGAEPDIEVMGTAADAYAAARRIQAEIPDVIILDVEMPGMDGITFLRKIMSQKPMPVVICSSLTDAGSKALVDAMEAGAVDVIAKPQIATKQFLMEAKVRVSDAVRAAAHSKRRGAVSRPSVVERKLTADVMLPPPALRSIHRPTEKIVCIGASTGGTEALRDVLEALPENSPGMVIVQHMPEHFTAAFARRLNGLCRVEVKEAEDGDLVHAGRVLIAPGNRHMLLQRNGTRYHVAIKDGPLVSRHRPSVDVLFRSAAQCAGANAIGVIMTGMGDDGAKGLLEMKQAGARTIAQDEQSCVVFGMPKEAIAIGAAEKIVPLGGVAREILINELAEPSVGATKWTAA
ncbi:MULTISPECIES: protein-glutamate methylesterase/protein-glutamine glutaminase [Methylosinus]|uniref:Protein-glutamate methylesterase/protein-glutamine glutaminase n=1 Tax=Methylosinus trichosporium (strain ATCC 35070 / NCIMB 11131 / UNIQEM 75 / OB3b) TaxID=595536 RepID=A0A2D2CZK4_METT3|nr:MULTISPECIES: chemotaxis response regulator protein-glutamate methylesterase [Methylosinus]ATQ68134.1 chemotaxis response regulator protein-glutamate methylesterase [Methylosinus trichosporium OB3b]OBS53522.1 chemotaxis response regulator protein-glutamate methylesterase [Methylosinus sp. 3S-1]